MQKKREKKRINKMFSSSYTKELQWNYCLGSVSQLYLHCHDATFFRGEFKKVAAIQIHSIGVIRDQRVCTNRKEKRNKCSK